MSMDKKPQALTAAYKDAVAKNVRIKELGITPDISQETIDKIVEDLSTAKALAEPGTQVKDFRSGQEWYVESLVTYSKLTAEERLEFCYNQKFAEQANEAEMIDALLATM